MLDTYLNKEKAFKPETVMQVRFVNLGKTIEQELVSCSKCRITSDPRVQIVDPFYGWVRIRCACGNCTAVYDNKNDAIKEWNFKERRGNVKKI